MSEKNHVAYNVENSIMTDVWMDNYMKNKKIPHWQSRLKIKYKNRRKRKNRYN